MYLLTGGSGVLGQELQKYLNCWAPNRSELNIYWNEDRIIDNIARHSPEYLDEIDAVIHLAAYTDVPKAEHEKRLSHKTNVLGTNNVKHAQHFLFKKMIYISTDYVYPGTSGGYRETDRAQPINFYAMTKYMGEMFMDRADLIIRTSFKPNVKWPYPGAFNDLYTSADYVDIIAPMIAKLIEGKATGIYNVGTKRKSIYDLAKQRNPGIKPMSRYAIKDVYLPYDISMNTKKYQDFMDKKCNI